MEKSNEKVCPLRLISDSIHNDRIQDLGWLPFITCLKDKCMWYNFCKKLDLPEIAKEIKL